MLGSNQMVEYINADICWQIYTIFVIFLLFFINLIFISVWLRFLWRLKGMVQSIWEVHNFSEGVDPKLDDWQLTSLGMSCLFLNKITSFLDEKWREDAKNDNTEDRESCWSSNDHK